MKSLLPEKWGSKAKQTTDYYLAMVARSEATLTPDSSYEDW